MTHECRHCGETKPPEQFFRPEAPTQCKVCYNTKRAAWRERNRKKTRAYSNARYKADAGGVKTKRRQYHRENREEISLKYKEYSQRPTVIARRKERVNKRLERQSFRIECRLRCRIHSALKYQGQRKDTKTAQLVGCSGEELVAKLEAQFLPGMTWDNHSPDGWHIDHIIPCMAFDLSDPEQQYMCFHWSNLRPMWGVENIAKHDSITEPNRRWNKSLGQWEA